MHSTPSKQLKMKQDFTVSLSFCCIILSMSFCLTAYNSGDWLHTCIPLKTILIKSSEEATRTKQTINLVKQHGVLSDPQLARKDLGIQAFYDENVCL